MRPAPEPADPSRTAKMVVFFAMFAVIIYVGFAVIGPLAAGLGIVTFGALGDCERSTEGAAVTWAKDTVDNIARVTATIFAYGKAAFRFVFQLLTFQLPIPVVFNMMIVLPPAGTLAAYGLQIVRGVGG